MKQTSRSHTIGLSASEIKALQEHRLESDYTYRQLADRIGIGLTKLHGLLNDPRSAANERTAFKVRRYLAGLPEKQVTV